MSSDPIADMLIRIKNGYLTKKKFVEIPFSKIKNSLAKILVKESYINNFDIKNENELKLLKLELKYDKKVPAITGIKRISKPGLRVYKGKRNIPRVLGGLGIAIISTPKGLMTGKEAYRNNLGGEIICTIW